MISVQINEKPDNRWNERLIESGLGTIYQTMEMAKYFEKQNLKSYFLKFIDNKGKIIGQLLVTEHSRLDGEDTARQLVKKILGKKFLYQWTYGPIVFDSNLKNEIYEALGNFVISKKWKVSGWEHPLSPSGVSILEKKFHVIHWSTFLIDLKKSKNELYQNIEKHNGRKNIERSIKRCVNIEEITEKSLYEYYQLRNKMTSTAGENSSEYENTLYWWNLFKPLGYTGFLATKDGKAVGGLLISYMSKQIIEGGVARSEEDLKNNLYSQDQIKWKIIEWGIKNQMNYYNLAGFNPNPKSKKEEGILRYKKKWGGKRYDYCIIGN